MSGKLQEVGRVTHFFSRINVAVVELKASIAVGDRILIKGPTTDLEQSVASMEMEHEKITHAEPGQSVGMKVDERVRENDRVYKVS